jgi:hypothetical protein
MDLVTRAKVNALAVRPPGTPPIPAKCGCGRVIYVVDHKHCYRPATGEWRCWVYCKGGER